MTLAAVGGAVTVGLGGLLLQLAGASLSYSDADRLPDDVWLRIWIGAGAPVLVVVIALVLARACRRTGRRSCSPWSARCCPSPCGSSERSCRT